MKNQLRISHFIQEPKPEIEDYINESGHEIVNNCLFEKDLKEWKEKYEEPEIEWVAFKEKEPYIGQLISDASTKHGLRYPHTQCYSRAMRNLLKADNLYATHWYDKESHDAKVKKYEENKVVFEGWGLHESFNCLIKWDIENDVFFYVDFLDDGIVKITNNTEDFIYRGLCDVELFKELGRVNGF